MKNSRLQKYLSNKPKLGTDPMTKKTDVNDSHDKHINQDYPGYPENEDLIKPKTAKEKKTAALDVKDGEKKISPNNKGITNEDEDDGSASAFAATEEVRE